MTILRGDRSANRDIDWLSYILLNSEKSPSNTQWEVLAHELVHAAGYSGDIDKWGDVFLHDSDPASLMGMYQAGVKRPTVSMREQHADALRKAYFARPA